MCSMTSAESRYTAICGRFNTKSGQALFTTLKLRSEGLVPSSGAQSAPPNSTYGSSTARLFPTRRALRTETCGRSAPRFAHIRKQGHGQQSVAPLAALAPQPPARRAGQSPTAPRGHHRPGASCRRGRQCPESAKINIILSRLCHSSHRGCTTAAATSIFEGLSPASSILPAAGEHNLDYVNLATVRRLRASCL